MGVLRQKCVPTYESFSNSSNFSSIGYNMSYDFYLKEIDNESMFTNYFLSSPEEIFDKFLCRTFLMLYLFIY